MTNLLKVGSQLFAAEGPQAVKKLAGLGFSVFLDLKFHDIPNTVAGAVASAAELPGVRMLTLHAAGGTAMMRAAREAAGNSRKRPALLGVTVLTSLDAAALGQIGFAGTPLERAVSLAQLAQNAGLDGIVASAHETRAVREAIGPKALIVVPGVRPASAEAGDQARIASPGDAIRASADFVVVGRPITDAKDPRAAALAITREIATISAT